MLGEHEGRGANPVREVTGSTIGLPAALEIVCGLTGRRRDRLFVYNHYVAILNEGMEVE